MSDSVFVLTTCQVGAEPALKAEMARLRPDYKLAYSRPGFITFKTGAATPDLVLGSAFARAYAVSLGKIAGPVHEKVDQLKALAKQHGARAIHVWERERLEHREAPIDPPHLIERVQQAIGVQPALKVGDVVLDAVVVEADEWWAGLHVHSADHRPWPGGLFDEELPESAPSRAYLKLVEGLTWSGLSPRAGERVLELGSAPGGASQALLERGLKVVGVDPGEMDERVSANPCFKHVHGQAAQLKAVDVVGIQWLVSDMNVPADELMRDVKKLVPWMRDSLKGALLTVKLRDWNAADEIPARLEELRALGFKNARAAHLCNNRQEVCVGANFL